MTSLWLLLEQIQRYVYKKSWDQQNEWKSCLKDNYETYKVCYNWATKVEQKTMNLTNVIQTNMKL